MKNITIIAVGVALAAALASTARGTVIVNGADALTWYDINTASGHGSTLSGSTLNVTSSTATDGTNISLANFTPQTLAAHDYRIELSFSLTVAVVANLDHNFRFGLFNSGSTLQAADATGTNPEALRDDLGYQYRIATDPSSTVGNFSRYGYTTGAGTTMALTSNNGSLTTIGGQVGAGNSTILSTTTTVLRLVLTRVGDTVIDIDAYRDGNLLDGGRAAVSATYTFDEIAFSMVDTNGTGYSIAGLQVQVIPEPSTGLLALVASGVLALRRRPRRK